MELRGVGRDQFVGNPPPDAGSRTYGGQLLAQSLRAAQATVSGDRAAHSLHSSFLHAGRAQEPLQLRVERLRDGRSFSQRQVIATQSGRPVLHSLISFHVPASGLEWQPPVSFETDPPATGQPYVDYCDVIESVLSKAEQPWSGRDRPMDVRYRNHPGQLDGQPVTETQEMWMRVHGPLDDDRSLSEVGIAYLSDLGMNPVILLPHGRSWRDERVTEASLDHTIWFHRPARADHWLRYQQRAESTAGGRGLATGRFYDVGGNLVATCAQEGLMRWNPQIAR